MALRNCLLGAIRCAPRSRLELIQSPLELPVTHLTMLGLRTLGNNAVGELR